MFSSGFAELVLVVADVREAARFYEEVVGLTPELEITDKWAWFYAGAVGEPTRLALAKGPLLFEGESPLGEDFRWGPTHYALRVKRSSFAEAIAHVRGCGVEVHGPTRLEWMKADSYYFYDPDGNLVEFWSPDPD